MPPGARRLKLLGSWFRRWLGYCCVFLFALAGSGEELFHAAGHFCGAVDGEGEFRDVAYTHAVAELGADEGTGRHEALECGGFFFLIAVDGDEDARGFAAGRKNDIGDIAGSDAWIGEFAFKHCANLFGEGIGDSVTVIRSSSLLGHMLSAVVNV